MKQLLITLTLLWFAGTLLQAQADSSFITTWKTDNYNSPDTAPFDGRSWDVGLQVFSEPGNANNAVATPALGGNQGDVPNIGSPGNGGVVVSTVELQKPILLQLFPNPTSGWVKIQPEVNGRQYTLRVFDAAGRPILTRRLDQGADLNLDLSLFPSGLYTVSVTDGCTNALARILKQ